MHQPVGFGVQSKYLAVKGGTRSAEVVLDEVSAEIDAHLPHVVEGTGCLGETELIPSSAVFCRVNSSQFESIRVNLNSKSTKSCDKNYSENSKGVFFYLVQLKFQKTTTSCASQIEKQPIHRLRSCVLSCIL